MHLYTITTKLACMGWEAVFGLISTDTFRKRYFAVPCTLSVPFQLRTSTDKCYLGPFRCVPQNRYFAESGVPFRSAE